MSAELRIAKSGARNAPTLPADAITRTFGIFGVKDSGKTTTGRVLVEEMCRIGGHAAVFDPVGVWWGATRDGRGRGIPGIVIGGEHADVPLEETGGQLVAELLVGRHWPVVIVDMKLLRKGAQLRFLADCLETVYFKNRRPLHLVFEEADRPLPQQPRGMDPTLGRVLGAAEDIVKLGRSRGLGSTFISQRLAGVTKNVTEQVQALCLHAQVGPRDRKAVKEWVEVNGDPGRTTAAMESMASLELGEWWLLSPQWLRTLTRMRTREPRTLDSSATPSDEEREVEAAAPRAPVDLGELRERMAETVQRARENDPRELRERIRGLERELAQARAEKPEPERVEVPVLDADAPALLGSIAQELEDALATSFEQVEQATQGAAERIGTVLGDGQRLIDDMRRLLGGSRSEQAPVPADVRSPARALASRPSPAPARAADPSMNGEVELKAGARRMLEAMASLHPAWLTRSQVGTLAKVKHSGGTFHQYAGTLRRAGAIEERGSGRSAEMRLTERGVGLLGGSLPAPATPEEVLARWRGTLKAGARAMLDALVERHPGWLRREELAELAGIVVTGGTFSAYLGTLRRAGLIEEGDGMVRAAETLFLGSRR